MKIKPDDPFLLAALGFAATAACLIAHHPSARVAGASGSPRPAAMRAAG